MNLHLNLQIVGALLMALSAFYIGLSAALCSDNRLVVLTRRELAGYFYSPIAYIVLFGLTIVGWGLYFWFISVAEYLSRSPQPLVEPIIKDYIFNLLPVVCAIERCRPDILHAHASGAMIAEPE